jgi:hypothetical protein
MSEPAGGFAFNAPLPEGYIDSHDTAAASAARKKRYEQIQAAEKQRAEAIAEAKAAAKKAAELKRNAFTFDPTPLKDANANPDNEGLMIDAAIHSLMLEPHRTLNPRWLLGSAEGVLPTAEG